MGGGGALRSSAGSLPPACVWKSKGAHSVMQFNMATHGPQDLFPLFPPVCGQNTTFQA